MTLSSLITDIGTYVEGALVWFGDVFTYLTSTAVFPFILIGIGFTIVGFAFKYVRSIIRG